MNIYEVKKYLGQIQTMEAKIRQKSQELEDLKLLATSTGAIRYDKDRVVTSVKGDRIAAQVAQYVDLETDVLADICRFALQKNIIVNEIQSLGDVRYIEILYKRFVQYMRLYDIADAMNYSYDHVKHLYRDALTEFGRRIDKTNE